MLQPILERTQGMSKHGARTISSPTGSCFYEGQLAMALLHLVYFRTIITS